MIHDLSQSNSLVTQFLSELRDVAVQTDRHRFRLNLERLGQIFAYEVSKSLQYTTREVTTPLGQAKCAVLKEPPVIATVLRAGVPFHHGFITYFDAADSAFFLAYRKHNEDGSFEIAEGYLACPKLDGRTLILVDPMLASGSSIVLALKRLLEFGNPSQIHLAAVIASKPGVDAVIKAFPKIELWAGAIDAKLDERSYIVPGLGDAGDLAFGEKEQH